MGSKKIIYFIIGVFLSCMAIYGLSILLNIETKYYHYVLCFCILALITFGKKVLN
ncbi:hypothetical protein C8P70_12432 [Myroides indicus]|uniref:Lipoprotein n=1 Tax=Myroides indicus TaxID=1323422 RepID=A0A4R7EVV0_9FLAO|nr:hypothetical protein C8P70_12432 [Myroides indicus]